MCLKYFLFSVKLNITTVYACLLRTTLPSTYTCQVPSASVWFKYQQNSLHIQLGLHIIIYLFCISVCGVDEFQCDETLCIPNSKRCNGLSECLDQTDERDCPLTPG